jgi:hypothetical protein
VAKAFRPMSRQEMNQVSGKLVAEHKARLDAYFNDHIDA